MTLSRRAQASKAFRKEVGGEHPGFAAVQKAISKRQGVGKGAAGAILASATRHASPAAKKANPNLRKVR